MRLDINENVEEALCLNCDNVHLVALLNFFGVGDAFAAIAAQWFFGWLVDPSTPVRVPTTSRVPILAAIAQETGVHFERLRLCHDDFYRSLHKSLDRGAPAIVYGDSYSMEWLPFYRNEHGAHPVIVAGWDAAEGIYHVVEAYRNRTPYGACHPSRVQVTSHDFDQMIRELSLDNADIIIPRTRERVRPTDLREVLRANAEAILQNIAKRGELRAYVNEARTFAGDLAAAQRFDLGCWEIARARIARDLACSHRGRPKSCAARGTGRALCDDDFWSVAARFAIRSRCGAASSKRREASVDQFRVD